MPYTHTHTHRAKKRTSLLCAAGALLIPCIEQKQIHFSGFLMCAISLELNAAEFFLKILFVFSFFLCVSVCIGVLFVCYFSLVIIFVTFMPCDHGSMSAGLLNNGKMVLAGSFEFRVSSFHCGCVCVFI